MKTRIYKNEEVAAIEVLRQTGVGLVDAALVAKLALEAGHGRVKRAMECIKAGEETLRMREKTVTFERAAREALFERKDRRVRTQSDFRYIVKRLIKRCKGLNKRRIRSITSKECQGYLHKAFGTPRQRNKARLILSGVFSSAMKRGWCAENPIRHVQPERIVEKRIKILDKEQIGALMETAAVYKGGSCMAAVGMMLYAGIRPYEVERLRWQDVRLEHGIICIAPHHSKTGGARCVTIHPPLAKLLRVHSAQKTHRESICPPNWRKHWAALHRKAGFATWQPDVLRHTFATHHLATFRSYAELQLEMGHRSAELLRTRYVSMEGIYRRGESILIG